MAETEASESLKCKAHILSAQNWPLYMSQALVSYQDVVTILLKAYSRCWVRISLPANVTKVKTWASHS
jgi:hypothetical protein